MILFRLRFAALLPALLFFSGGQPEISMVSVETRLGRLLVRLSRKTPGHTQAFLRLARAGYWDSLSFNRIVPGFVVQGGCPDTPEGFAGSPHLLDPEFHDSLRHVYGAFGAGRDDNPRMQSAICQFYIVQAPKGVARLDGKYTVFGQVVKGMEVAEAMAALPRLKSDQPAGEPVTVRIRPFFCHPRRFRKEGIRVLSPDF
jgi:peptidyl-prolyl cis-trans isomerase B (cyclophilin B)